MAERCREIHEWIEEQVEKPIETWIERRERKCRERDCNWWCACCNKWFCWIETFLERVVTWVVVTVGKWVTRVVCEIVHGLLDFAGVLVGLIFAIPILGRLLREIWDILVEIVWRIVGVLGLIADLLGLEFTKRLRVCIIILRADGKPLADPADLDADIAKAKTIYRDAAKVEFIVQGIHTIGSDAPEHALDVACGAGAWWDDLWLSGRWFELIANTYCFDGAGRRLLGWAAPVIVFVVRDVEGKLGCSIGPFSDYVTIEAGNPICLAHEVGHACSLWHYGDRENLMNGRCGGTLLRKWQRVLLRNSRHVTYL